jgi:hypothetical protein
MTICLSAPLRPPRCPRRPASLRGRVSRTLHGAARHLLKGASIAVLLTLLTATPAEAQYGERSYGNRSGASAAPTSQREAPQHRSAPERLPSWAEPRRPRAPTRAPSPPPADAGAKTHDLNPPTNPDRVPLGGLEWLLAAGMGYATWRLRGEEDEADEDAVESDRT